MANEKRELLLRLASREGWDAEAEILGLSPEEAERQYSIAVNALGAEDFAELEQ